MNGVDETLINFQVATSLLRSLEESAFLVADVARDGEEYLEEATREIGKENLDEDFSFEIGLTNGIK